MNENWQLMGDKSNKAMDIIASLRFNTNSPLSRSNRVNQKEYFFTKCWHPIGLSFYNLLTTTYLTLLDGPPWFQLPSNLHLTMEAVMQSWQFNSACVWMRPSSRNYLLLYVFTAIRQILMGGSHMFQSNQLKKGENILTFSCLGQGLNPEPFNPESSA